MADSTLLPRRSFRPTFVRAAKIILIAGGVLALLVAMVGPAIRNAREAARRNACI